GARGRLIWLRHVDLNGWRGVGDVDVGGAGAAHAQRTGKQVPGDHREDREDDQDGNQVDTSGRGAIAGRVVDDDGFAARVHVDLVHGTSRNVRVDGYPRASIEQ